MKESPNREHARFAMTVDADAVGAPISKYLYGQFILVRRER